MRSLILLLILIAGAGHPSVAADDGLDEVSTAAESGQSRMDLTSWIAGRASSGKSFALIVGISRYQGFGSLESTVGDPERMRRFLLDRAGFDQVHILTEDAVTRDRLRTLILDELPRVIGENDRFLLYWSGHGVPVENHRDRQLGYLPLATSKADSVASMLAMKDVLSWTELIRAKQVLHVLDTCFSGLALIETQGTRGGQTIDLLFKPARHLLTATGSGRTIASRAWSGGMFTDAFIKGAGGEADGSDDGVVTLLELENFIRERMDRERRFAEWPDEIIPQSFDLQPNEGEFFFVVDGEKLAPTRADGDRAEEDDAPVTPMGRRIDASEGTTTKLPGEDDADFRARAAPPHIAKGHLKQRLDLKMEPRLGAKTIKTLSAGELVDISEIVAAGGWARIVTRHKHEGYIHLDGVNVINIGN